MKDIFTNFVDIKNTSSSNQDYVSHLCQHFFHSSRPHFHENDILYFFEFVATLQFDILAGDKHCVTLGVLKHFMLTVMSMKDGEDGTKNIYGLSPKVQWMISAWQSTAGKLDINQSSQLL